MSASTLPATTGTTPTGSSDLGNGLVLTLCCVWVAAIAIRRDRDWKALAAPVLAPVGAVAFFVFLKARTGSFTAWFTVERNGWNERFDFASNNWNHAHRFLRSRKRPRPHAVLRLGGGDRYPPRPRLEGARRAGPGARRRGGVLRVPEGEDRLVHRVVHRGAQRVE